MSNELKISRRGGAYQEWFGRRFYLEKRTGRFRGNAAPRLAHRWVWENVNGSIPVDLQVHHIDRNPGNNDPSNLMLVTKDEHWELHDRIDPTSRVGLGDQEKLPDGVVKWCDECNKPYEVRKRFAWATKYCSLTCKNRKCAREYRKIAPTVEKTCERCHRSFFTKVIYDCRFCSKSCSSLFRAGK